LTARGARVLAAEPDQARAEAAVEDYGVTIVSLDEGLDATGLVFDAAPVADLIDEDRITASSIAAVPAVPSGVSTAAQAAMGARHIHEPLAVGVAVMAVEALSGRVSTRARLPASSRSPPSPTPRTRASCEPMRNGLSACG
jgi:hypothetical protein